VYNRDIVVMSLRLRKGVEVEVDIKSGDYCSDLGVLLSKAPTRS
jgi:hypothetical protein